jgi:hypothetical protein
MANFGKQPSSRIIKNNNSAWTETGTITATLGSKTYPVRVFGLVSIIAATHFSDLTESNAQLEGDDAAARHFKLYRGAVLSPHDSFAWPAHNHSWAMNVVPRAIFFQIVKRFHDNLGNEIKPSVGTSNSEELIFDKLDSGYIVTVASGEGTGRSATAQLLHASEVAFWDDLPSQAAALMQSRAGPARH